MGFFKDTKGAVSMFLVIILVPIMTVSGVFIDVSRSKLAQETVTTSADLALNTVLSSYDKNLKDYFGLFGSAKNAGEAIALAKEYFSECLVSANFETSTALGYVNNITSSFGVSNELYDMLRLSVDGDISVSGSENGALDNPALLKTQIVEFMKYRAPINGAAELFEKIANSDVAEKVEAASLEATMTEKKKLFYEAEKKLIKQAEKAYNAIKKYQNYKTKTDKKISEEKYLDDLSVFLRNPNGDGRSFEVIFKDAHTKLVKDLYNTHDANGNNAINLLTKKSITTQNEVSTYSENNKASAANIKERLENFNTCLKTYYSCRDTLNTAWNNVGVLQSSDYAIQYWVVLTNKCKSAYNNYVSAAKNLWYSANRLENAVKFAADEAMDTKMTKPSNSYVTFPSADSSGKLTYQEIYDTLIGNYNGSLKSEVTGSNRGCASYRNINTQINKVNTDSNKNKLKLENIGHIFNIRNKVNNYYSDLESGYKLAKDAKEKTNKLKKLLKDYKTAFENWDKAAFNSGLDNSDLAAEDRKTINELRQTGIEKFSEQSVVDLTNRLKNIQELWETLKKDIKDIKYRSASVKDLTNYSTLRSKSGLDASKIVRNNNSLAEYVESSFSFSIGTEIQRIEIRDGTTSTDLDGGDYYSITDSFHPNIEKTKLELYDWMVETFSKPKSSATLNEKTHGFSVSDEDSAEEADGKIEDKSESTSTADTSENITSGKSFSEWTGAALPTNSKQYQTEETELTAKISEAASFASEIFGNFSDTFMNSLVSMRDDLFMLDYVFSMFTHDTFENEGYYKYVDDSVKSQLKPTNVDGYYKNETVKNQWKSKDNKTLTLTPRDTSNNWAYGSEIEYILYGSKSNATNKVTAYSKIFLLRYALDLAAVFDCYWDDPVVKAVAAALQALAYIPEALTKTLICLAVTAAEAGVDITYLRAGLPVTLIKIDEDDLICNYQSVFLGSDTEPLVQSNKLALQYSDYLKVFLYLKLLGSNENAIYARTGDIIQANLSLSTDDFEFALSKAQVFYELDTAVIMEPMWSRLLAIDDLGDFSTSKGWRSIDIKMKRGY